MPFFKSVAEKASPLSVWQYQIHLNHIKASDSATEGDPFISELIANLQAIFPLTKPLLSLNKKKMPGLK